MELMSPCICSTLHIPLHYALLLSSVVHTTILMYSDVRTHDEKYYTRIGAQIVLGSDKREWN